MTPDYKLEKLPPQTEKIETIRVLRQTTKAATALAELKGIAKTIPNQITTYILISFKILNRKQTKTMTI